MNKFPLSVFIIAQDEADRIVKSIKSVIDWADEVIIIDSGSKDETVEIAKNLGAKTHFNEWNGYGLQKIYGENLCQNDWILNIDADEEVTQKLAQEIQQLFAEGIDEKSCYKMHIKIMSRFQKKPSKFAPGHNQIRLYNKNLCGFKDSTVHDSVIIKQGVKCEIKQLKNIVNHRTFRSYKHAVAKINRYSSMQAEDMFAKGKKPSSLRILFEPFFAFFKAYFLKRFIFMGFDGIIEAFIYSFARTIRLAKARELFKLNK